jgi:hypothetical protein
MIHDRLTHAAITSDTVRRMLLHGGSWAFISACKGDDLDQDVKLTSQLGMDLERQGFIILPVIGVWEGATEWSYLVLGISHSTAVELGRNYDQYAVLTDTGLYDCQTGQLTAPIRARAITTSPVSHDHSAIYAYDGRVNFIAYL